MINMRTYNICPRCRHNEMLYPEEINALSRMNNRTYVCSPCGEDEAILDYAGVGQAAPWPITRELMDWRSLYEKR